MNTIESVNRELAHASWESDREPITQVDALARVPSDAMVACREARGPVARVYQVKAGSPLAELTARGWAALFAMEAGS